MRIGSTLMLALVGYSAAVACGGSSEVLIAGDPEDGGEAGTGGKGGPAGKGGTAGKGSGGKGGGKSGGSGEAGQDGKGASGGQGGSTGGSAGDPGVAGVGGQDGELGGFGGESATGGGSGTGGTNGGSGAGGTSGDAGSGGVTTGGAGGAPGLGGEGGVGGGEGGAAGLGSLRVLVSPPSGGSAVEVDVNGPSLSRTVDRSTLFSDVLPGQYTVAASSSRVSHPIVSSIFDARVVGAPATVVGGRRANVSVVYPVPRGGTGRLWATDILGGKLSAFDASGLQGSTTAGDDAADLVMTVAGNSRVSSALAFDAAGNAWIGDCGRGDVVMIPSSALGDSGATTKTPPIVIGPPAESWATCVVSLDFDASGALYATYARNGVVKWTPDQLATSATPNSTPAAFIRSTHFNDLQDAVFDPTGNLWVSSYTNGEVVMFLPSQLETTNTNVTPTVIWSVPSAEGLVFGPDGNLWVSTYDNHVRAYDSTSVTIPTPARSITVTGGPGLWGIGFDESGNLWASSFNFGSILRINAADLTTDGAKAPALELTNNGIQQGAALLFNPGP